MSIRILQENAYHIGGFIWDIPILTLLVCPQFWGPYIDPPMQEASGKQEEELKIVQEPTYRKH